MLSIYRINLKNRASVISNFGGVYALDYLYIEASQ